MTTTEETLPPDTETDAASPEETDVPQTAPEPEVEVTEAASEPEAPAAEPEAPEALPAAEEPDADATEPGEPAVAEDATAEAAPAEDAPAEDAPAEAAPAEAAPADVPAWWQAWGQLRGFLVSATDRGAPHPEMADSAAKLIEQGAPLEHLREWVPQPDERSRLERSRRSVNAASNADDASTMDAVYADLAGEGPVWDQLRALAEGWITARRAGHEAPRRARRKPRARTRGKDSNGSKAKAEETEAAAPRPRRERDRRRRRRGQRKGLPRGAWAAGAPGKFGGAADELTVFAWVEPSTDEVPGAVAGVVWEGWNPDLAALPAPDLAAGATGETGVLEALANLKRSGQALPFSFPGTAGTPTESADAALRLLFGWLLPDGEKADVRIALSHPGLVVPAPEPVAETPVEAPAEQANAEPPAPDADAPAEQAADAEAAPEGETPPEVDPEAEAPDETAPEAEAAPEAEPTPEPEPDEIGIEDVSEHLRATLSPSDEALADRFQRWSLDRGAWITVKEGAPASFGAQRLSEQGYLGFARILAQLRPGGRLSDFANRHVTPTFDADLTFDLADVSAIESVAAIDRTAATDDLLRLLPKLRSTPLLEPIVQTAKRRIGRNAGMQLRLLLGMDAQVRSGEQSDSELLTLVDTLRPIFGELPGATPPAIRLLWLRGELKRANRHEALTEVVKAWWDQRDQLAGADLLALATADLELLARLHERLDHEVALALLTDLAGRPGFTELPAALRAEVAKQSGTALSVADLRFAADQRFADAIETIEASDLDDEARQAAVRGALRLRAMNAMDAGMYFDADADADVPTTDIEVEAPQVEAPQVEAAETAEVDAPAEPEVEIEIEVAEAQAEVETPTITEPEAEAPGEAAETEVEAEASAPPEVTEVEAETPAEAEATEPAAEAEVEATEAAVEAPAEPEPEQPAKEEPAPAAPATREEPGSRAVLADRALALVQAYLGTEDLAAAAKDLAKDDGTRADDHHLLLRLLWCRDDLADVESAYLRTRGGGAHSSPMVDMYRALLMFMAGKDRDAEKALSRSLHATRELRGPGPKLTLATLHTIGACIGRKRSHINQAHAALRSLRDQLPAATARLDTLDAILAKPNEDLVDLALGSLPFSMH